MLHGPPSGPEYPLLHEHMTLPVDEYEPLGHVLQVLSDVAPIDSENFPATQSVHGESLISDLYFPATHRRQFPSTLVHPAWHSHFTAPGAE